jgi:catechol 2,3-dioxygenase-like lactoylglutathione lyase family enzyme
MSQQTATAPATTPFAYGDQVTVAINVSDFERAIAWYREAFGFELIYKLDDWKWCELRTPIAGVNVGLGQTDDETHGGMSATFVVADIEAAKAHIESMGVVFDDDIHEVAGMVKLAFFRDPDGNALGIAEHI